MDRYRLIGIFVGAAILATLVGLLAEGSWRIAGIAALGVGVTFLAVSLSGGFRRREE